MKAMNLTRVGALVFACCISAITSAQAAAVSPLPANKSDEICTPDKERYAATIGVPCAALGAPIELQNQNGNAQNEGDRHVSSSVSSDNTSDNHTSLNQGAVAGFSIETSPVNGHEMLVQSTFYLSQAGKCSLWKSAVRPKITVTSEKTFFFPQTVTNSMAAGLPIMVQVEGLRNMQHCINAATFVPAIGHKYNIRQIIINGSWYHYSCKLSISDAGDGLPPPSLQADRGCFPL